MVFQDHNMDTMVFISNGLVRAHTKYKINCIVGPYQYLQLKFQITEPTISVSFFALREERILPHKEFCFSVTEKLELICIRITIFCV